MTDAADSDLAPAVATAAAAPKSTGSLGPVTEDLASEPAPAKRHCVVGDFMLRLAELAAFLVAIVGAVAFGLGITDYFREHIYIAAYLLAYAGFRCADLLVRDDYGPDPARDALARRMTNQVPLLVLFAAAPAERTYLYGGEAPKWITALALLLELLGLWIALGGRIQLGFFSTEIRESVEHRVLVRNGFYRFIRHPTYAGVLLALFAWPIAYGAPFSAVLVIAIGATVVRRAIEAEEVELVERFGGDYLEYQKRTDAIIPNLW